MTRHHAHTSDHMVMAVGAVIVIACATGIAVVMVRVLGGAS